jgi:hypothetical protein
MPWFPNPNGGAPIQAATNPNPAGGSYGYYSDPGYTGPAPSTGGGGSVSAPGTVQAPATVQPVAANDPAARAIQQGTQMLNSSDLKAFNEQVREWDKIFGFNTEQWQEGVRQYNQNFGVTQAGLTGTYQGAPTQQALNQAANFLGTYQGQQTQQAQNQAANLTGVYSPYAPGNYVSDPASGAVYAVGPNGQVSYIGDPRVIPPGTQISSVPGLGAPVQTANGFVPSGLPSGKFGTQTLQAQNQGFNQNMAVASLAASLQANPFRQQQVLGQAQRILGGQSVAGFQAPNTVAGVGTAGGNTQGGMGYLQQIVDDIKNPTANQTTADQFIASTPTPNKLDSTSFIRSAPSTQNLVLQAMQEKYGIDPKDALTQIQNTLPQFQSPTLAGSVKR